MGQEVVRVKNSELSAEEISRLYSLYHLTYAKLGDAPLLDEASFNGKVSNTYNEAVILKVDGVIQTGIFIRNTEFGGRISLIFGGDEYSKERMAILRELIKEGCYIEASGAPAKNLLKDPNVKVFFSTRGVHYYAHVASHGKKLIFGGDYKSGLEVSQGMRSFLFFLYEYHKIKLNSKGLSDFEQVNKDLLSLFEKLMADMQMPAVYQLILASKICRKLFDNNYTEAPILLEKIDTAITGLLQVHISLENILHPHSEPKDIPLDHISNKVFSKLEKVHEKNESKINENKKITSNKY